MTWLFDVLLKILLSNEEPEIMWYRIDRITRIQTTFYDKQCNRIGVEYGVDAICAATPYDALAIASHRNSLKHGQMFQAVFSNTMKDHHRAVAISRERDKEIVEFEAFMKLEYKAKQGRANE